MNRAARRAPRTKVSRLWERCVSSRRSPRLPKLTVCSPTTSPERIEWMPISCCVRSPGRAWRPVHAHLGQVAAERLGHDLRHAGGRAAGGVLLEAVVDLGDLDVVVLAQQAGHVGQTAEGG